MLLSPLWVAAFSGGIFNPYIFGGISSVNILGDSLLDESSGVGVNGSGWAARVVLRGIVNTSGAVDATKLVLTVSDPGWNSDGTATTRTRTIRGGAVLRRRYPNGAQKQISTDGNDVSIVVSLDDVVFAGSTILAAEIELGFYPEAVASVAPLRTNSSTLGYIKPSWGWLQPQFGYVTGPTFDVEGVTFHPYMQDGSQVACVEYSIAGGAVTRVVQTSLSAKITASGLRPECWAAALDTAGTPQGAQQVRAVVRPWLGDVSAVLDTSTDGVAWPSPLPVQPLRIYVDTAGTYGGAYAYVKAGVTGGAVSADPTTARAAPYPTVSGALSAVRAWNLANRGHGDIGGAVVRLMDADGADVTHTISTGITTSWGGATYCTIERDPLAVGVVSVTWTANAQYPDKVRWRNLRIVASTGAYLILGPNTSGSVLHIDSCEIDNTANRNISAYYDFPFVTNVKIAGSNSVNFTSLAVSGSTQNGVALLAGCYSTSGARVQNNCGLVTVGNSFPVLDMIVTAADANRVQHGKIIYGNRFNSVKWNSGGVAMQISGLPSFVGNIIERYTGEQNTLHLFADGDVTTVPWALSAYNTCVGERSSRAYNDVAATNLTPSGTLKRLFSMHEITDNQNWKGDTFPAGAPVGGPGSWMHAYGVGRVGGVNLFGDVTRSAAGAPHNDNTDAPYFGMHWSSGSEYNLQRQGLSQAQVVALFTSYTVAPSGTSVAGGDYRPKPTSTHLQNRVTRRMGLRFDTSGTVRRLDGSGAPGALEW